ncbi:glycosyltransferase [Lactiplantibacillus paraplantarum]|uniref:glycosyltransferase n=1 Tax=Lactiplantibacillus paraplantarum TaxID=60520 RepID=UPI0023AA7C74|nr:glycosyltransferase [Lactiplantibacillus paraplantarum]WEE36920.1 glycosyltransferase [Lactiplantibacillus paraplantarum]
MTRVMQINSGQKFGGVSSMIFNWYKDINREEVQFDFVAPKTTSFKIYEDTIKSMNGRIYELKTSGNLVKRKIQFFYRLTKLIRKNKYDVVHINSGSIFLNIQVSWIAKFCGVKKIIVHSHNSGNDNTFLTWFTKICKPLLEFGPTLYFACSRTAADFMFTKKRIDSGEYTIINNGVDVDRFKYRPGIREEYRKNLGLNSKLVLLHVGRFAPAKNHAKLIEIFNHFHQIHSEAVLLLVGEGELLGDVRKQVTSLGLEPFVRFLGLRKDIPELMSAADLFILPSLYEGLPVVGVEAQASGLPCVFSESITHEVDILKDHNQFVDLSRADSYWEKQIMELISKSSKFQRGAAAEQVAVNGYSLKKVAKQLENLYLQV